ncbi:Rne/Rng family ribonuclease [Pelagibius sp. CAU 1746]|uniref:Rne/Rng family ribonuclease n=1 Tax=Pelagibius sp. CAU 1746 TaxID=3140370 RepID=UPI00325A6F5D
MAKRMLIDASHPEETRVVVQSGNRLEDFDYETSSRKQLKGNIYLAKVTRVEPSLQAAFVDYGGNRHGFLPFSEIHPDYYRIPIADREALLAEEAALKSEPADEAPDGPELDVPDLDETDDAGGEPLENAPLEDGGDTTLEGAEAAEDEDTDAGDGAEGGAEMREAAAEGDAETADDEDGENGGTAADPEQVETEESVDTVGGDELEDAARRRAQLLRRYKIQEVIKRRQVMLVQVTKEERGNKGAALTTYLSLPGRYCVLMPNTNKGGGISRKISNASDRRRLKGILADLEIPDGIAVIVRTAGSQRTKVEIRRDYEYLLRLWDNIRQSTLQSTAPALIYEEANLIKRAIRDLYSRDTDEVLVDGDEGYKAAKDFMKSLTPSHAKKVQQYKDINVPLFQRYQVESQLDAMHSNTVQLRSGGYLVFNQTEALVAVDVNSGRATRERHIEETALKTNLEAAEEVGRQLRLRDLAGLIVIDFIDMEESRRNREVERRLKEALRHDRARIQLGRISPFGLLEMSRQRMRPSLFESSTETCPHCKGDGRVRTVESLALQVLRRLEEEGIREAGGEMTVTVPTQVALYLLNRKRDHLVAIEQRYDFKVSVETDDHLATDDFTIERDGAVVERRAAPAEERRESRRDSRRDSRREAESEDGERKRGRRRRSRRRRDEEEETESQEMSESLAEEDEAAEDREVEAGEEQDGERPRKRKRRGKRGGRRRARRRDDEGESETQDAVEAADAEAEEGAEAETEDAAEDEVEENAKPRGRRRRSTRKAEPEESTKAEAEDAAEDGGIEAGASEAAAEAEEEAKPKSRRRGTRGSRGTRGGRGRAAKPAAGDSGEEALVAAEDSAEAPAGDSPVGESPVGEPEIEEPAAAAAATEDAEAEEDAAEAPALAAAGTPRPDITSTDPKVVIEPATPASSAAAEQVGDQEVETLEPPRSEKSEDDQPKRRGWWNRFV